MASHRTFPTEGSLKKKLILVNGPKWQCKFVRTDHVQIVSFGYTPKHLLLLGTPAGVVEIIALLLCGWYGDKTGNRLLVSTVGLAIGIIGTLLLVALPEHANIGRIVGYYLILAVMAPFVALLSIISSNVAGYTKKTTVAALYFIAYCAGNIIGSDYRVLITAQSC